MNNSRCRAGAAPAELATREPQRLPSFPGETLFAALDFYHDRAPHSAAMNMAIDEALLEYAAVPLIRFYRWQSPALSFGYFGRFTDVASYQCERDLVRRWTGGGIVFHVRGIGAEAINHLLDSVGNDAEFGTFASGMNQPDSRGFLIDNVNRAAVGNVNAQDDAALIGNKSVAAGEFTAHRAVATTTDNLNFVPVNLLGGK